MGGGETKKEVVGRGRVLPTCIGDTDCPHTLWVRSQGAPHPHARPSCSLFSAAARFRCPPHTSVGRGRMELPWALCTRQGGDSLAGPALSDGHPVSWEEQSPDPVFL